MTEGRITTAASTAAAALARGAVNTRTRTRTHLMAKSYPRRVLSGRSTCRTRRFANHDGQSGGSERDVSEPVVGTTEGDSSREPAPFAMPDRIAIDAKGYGWRVWNDEAHWSMIPVNPDNSPIPYPVTWFVPDDPGLLGTAVLGGQLATATGLLDELINWFGAPDWEGPQVPMDLARRIAAFFADQADEEVPA